MIKIDTKDGEISVYIEGTGEEITNEIMVGLAQYYRDCYEAFKDKKGNEFAHNFAKKQFGFVVQTAREIALEELPTWTKQ